MVSVKYEISGTYFGGLSIYKVRRSITAESPQNHRNYLEAYTG